MFDLILKVVQNDERIRAVYMNGSRTNPNAPKDIFQDYDIVYVVNETASFIKDENWIDSFGDLIMIQEPDKNDKRAVMDMDFDKSYGYLMLFTDGNRIDLRIKTKEAITERYTKDKPTIPFSDKDKMLPNIPKPTDMDYWVKNRNLRAAAIIFGGVCKMSEKESGAMNCPMQRKYLNLS